MMKVVPLIFGASILFAVAGQGYAVRRQQECSTLIQNVLNEIQLAKQQFRTELSIRADLHAMVVRTLNTLYGNTKQEIANVYTQMVARIRDAYIQKAIFDVKENGIDTLRRLQDKQADEFVNLYENQIMQIMNAGNNTTSAIESNIDSLQNDVNTFCKNKKNTAEELRQKIFDDMDMYARNLQIVGNFPSCQTVVTDIFAILQTYGYTTSNDSVKSVRRTYAKTLQEGAQLAKNAISMTKDQLMKYTMNPRKQQEITEKKNFTINVIRRYQDMDISLFMRRFAPFMQQIVQSRRYNLQEGNQLRSAMSYFCEASFDGITKLQNRTIDYMDSLVVIQDIIYQPVDVPNIFMRLKGGILADIASGHYETIFTKAWIIGTNKLSPMLDDVTGQYLDSMQEAVHRIKNATNINDQSKQLRLSKLDELKQQFQAFQTSALSEIHNVPRYTNQIQTNIFNPYNKNKRAHNKTITEQVSKMNKYYHDLANLINANGKTAIDHIIVQCRL